MRSFKLLLFFFHHLLHSGKLTLHLLLLTILLYDSVVAGGGCYNTAPVIYFAISTNVDILNTMISTNIVITIAHVYLMYPPSISLLKK